MATIPISFGIESYVHRTLPLSAQNCINYYLEPAPPKAKALAAVVPSYGIREVATIGNSFSRGGAIVNAIPYVVYGQTLYRVTAQFGALPLGDIPGSSFCDIVGDETHVAVLTSRRLFVWNGVTVNEVVSEGYPGGEWLEYMDGYYIVGVPDSQQFAISANRDPSTWDALDAASAEKYPDNLRSGIVAQGELVLFGSQSFEIWYDSGDADFPFKRADNGFGDIGCISRYALARSDSSVFFLGNDGVVYRLNGYTPQRISTPAIEQAVEDAADKTCFCMCWDEGGHKFVSFSFDDKTFVYDIATQLWHQRQSYGLTRWRPLFVLRAYDQWLAGDFYSNQLGVLDPYSFSEFGHVLRGEVTSPAISENNRMIAHDRVELVFEQGVGLQSGQGSDPQVMLSYSDDGGRKFKGEKWRSLGEVGRFRRRAIWNRTGTGRDRVFKFAISDPVPRTLVQALSNSTATGI